MLEIELANGSYTLNAMIWGDGWNGNYFHVYSANATFVYWTLDSGYDGSVTFDLSSGFANLSASNIIYDQDQDLLSVDITNSGEVAAWDIGVAYNFNSDPSGDCEYGNVDDVFILDGIAAGETVTFSVSGLEAYVGFGTHEIHIVVDYYCTVEESVKETILLIHQ